ncbi:hypothetical protein LCGC14_2083690 [marine sediment metagenome]|uniref:Uncharacterized protein n=1 Tax=marine sediment metagenome TaxID=412755 RepID=A0A0F9HBV5_9ZZZZ
MPEEGKTQVVVVTQTLLPGTGFGKAFEMGARGQAVKLLAVHHSWGRVRAEAVLRSIIGISSNPEHATAVPPNENAFLGEKSIYGLVAFGYDVVVGAPAVQQVTWVSAVIPLYGLIRPRRQLMVGRYGGNFELTWRMEVYYVPLDMEKTELDTLNLKYGKYRRTG